MKQEASSAEVQTQGDSPTWLPQSWWEWLNLNVRRGCSDTSLLADLLKGGFELAQAQQALEAARNQSGSPSAGVPIAAAATHLPRLPEERSTVSIERARIRVRIRMRTPELALLDNVLSHQECLALIGPSSGRVRSIDGVLENRPSKCRIGCTPSLPPALTLTMRLDSEQRQTIVRETALVLGPRAKVRLFGVDRPVLRSAQLAARLQRALGDRRIDVLVIDPHTTLQPVHRVALSQGVELSA